jgi:hypothetical protein
MAGYKSRCYSGTNVYMSAMTAWRCDVYHTHIPCTKQSWNKVSVSECLWHYFFKSPCSNDNGVRVVYFPTMKNLSKGHCSALKLPYIYLAPCDVTFHNQIDHILTEWHSGTLNVHSFRGADCDTQVGTQHFWIGRWRGADPGAIYNLCLT